MLNSSSSFEQVTPYPTLPGRSTVQYVTAGSSPGLQVSQSAPGVVAIRNNGARVCILDFVSDNTRAAITGSGSYTDAAQAELTAAYTACLTKAAFFPPGIYYVSTPIVLRDNTQWSGAGMLSTYLRPAAQLAGRPMFTCSSGSVPYLLFQDMTIGGPSCSSAFDFSPIVPPQQGPYASIFRNLILQGGSSHAYYDTSAFQNMYENVTFSTVNGAGNGCVADGNKSIWQLCAWGPFGAAGVTACKTKSGGTFLNCNGLYYNANKPAAKVYEFGGASPDTNYPRAVLINCNLEDFAVTGISFIQQPVGITVEGCTFTINSTAPIASIRSLIDNYDADPSDTGSTLPLIYSNNRAIILKPYDTTVNPTGSEILTQGSSAPSGVVYQATGPGAAPNSRLRLANGVNIAHRNYLWGTRLMTATLYPGTSDRVMSLYNTSVGTDVLFVGQTTNTPTTLASGTTAIAVSTSEGSRRLCFRTANAVATQLQRVIGDSWLQLEGTLFYVIIGDANTTVVHRFGSNIAFDLKSGANETPAAGVVYQFMYTNASGITNYFRQL